MSCAMQINNFSWMNVKHSQRVFSQYFFVFRCLTLKPIHKIQLHKVVLSEKTRFSFSRALSLIVNSLFSKKMTDTHINVGHNNQNPQNTPNFLIQFNFDYFKTRDGLLKVLQLVSLPICYLFKLRLKVALDDSVAFPSFCSFDTYALSLHLSCNDRQTWTHSVDINKLTFCHQLLACETKQEVVT